MAETASAQVSAAVQAALASAARYVALVTQGNPLGSADALLARPDIDAVLLAALEQARQAAAAVVRQEWDAQGAPGAPVLTHLLADIDRQYGSLAHLRHLVRTAHASVPQRRFVKGQTRPGTSPAIEAGNERARAVRDAILGFARQASLRSHLTVAVAQQAARAAVVLAQGKARRAAGEKVFKRWEASMDGKDPRSCHWCRKLHGVTIGLDESFLPYLGGPADLSGHGHLTQPPKPYRGALQAPPMHPRCRCRLVIVTEPKHGDDRKTRPAETPDTSRSAPSTPGFITAAAIRAMPEQQYRALDAFLKAALHELSQVLGRLVQAVR